MNSPSRQNADQLRVTEIFYSLQGESSSVGIPTVFVRLTGCPLRCNYCDTTYAFQGGEWMEIEKILSRIDEYNTSYVTITGGEPLAQKNCKDLLIELCDRDYTVSLETSGAIDVSDIDNRVIKVMDLKTPGSGECERNLLNNIDYLSGNDQIKFVICDLTDYEWSKTMIEKYQLPSRCEVLMSPCYGVMNATALANHVLKDQLPVRFQLQLHKQLWGEENGR